MSQEHDLEQLVEGVTATSKAVTSKRTPLLDWVTGEFFGTFILVFFGCGSVAAAVLLGAQVGVFQVAIVWGLGIATAIYLTGSLSGAHLNPAVTLAMAVWSDFPKSRVLPYIGVQMLGAFAASALLFGIFGDSLRVYEKEHAIVRDAPGGEATAMIFGEYFPNPGGKPLDDSVAVKFSGRNTGEAVHRRERMSHGSAFLAEVAATAILVLVIFCVTDERNTTRPQLLTPVTIGLTVTLLISLIGPLTMACMNPARDLAPRVFSSLAGWGSVPFTVNGNGWLTVYIIAPLLGGLLGGGIYRVLFRPAYRLK
jgi:glycerol uptake facilitator protein